MIRRHIFFGGLGLLVSGALALLIVGVYRMAYAKAERDTDRRHHAELMMIAGNLYAAAEHGDAEGVRFALVNELLCARLLFEQAVPEPERRLLSPNYERWKLLSESVVVTNVIMMRGEDGLWVPLGNPRGKRSNHAQPSGLSQ